MTTPTPAGRYMVLIEATLREGLSHLGGATEPPQEAAAFRLERTLPAVAARLGLRQPSGAAESAERVAHDFGQATRVVDRADHARPAYAALAVRALLNIAGGSAVYQRFASANADGVTALAGDSLPIRASHGQRVVAAVFAAWVIASPGGQPSADATPLLRPLAIDALRRVARGQQADGTFLARTGADAPEPRWYDELAILHALDCFASETDDPDVADAVRRAVKYHAAETQPDHASSHPWAIAAFLAEPEAVPLADMMLHAAGVQSPRTMDAVSLLLLSDALDCGKRRDAR